MIDARHSRLAGKAAARCQQSWRPKPPDRPPDPEDGILLRAEGVTKRFEGLTANRDIDFDIPPHSIVAIVGPNGAGKTDVLRPDHRHLRTDLGDDRASPVSTSPACHLMTWRSSEIARTYQNIRLFHNMTTLANVIGRPSRPACGPILRRDSADALQSGEREGGHRAGAPRSCCSWSASGAPQRSSWPRTCRMAISAGSSGRERWRRTRSCCCWTSRPLA